jgi:hypothetical protein
MPKLTIAVVLAIPPLLCGCAGTQTKQQADFQQQVQTTAYQLQAVDAQYRNDLQSPELDPIRQKVELYRAGSSAELPPPFAIATNDTFPTESERPAIAKWAVIRDATLARINALRVVPPSATAYQRVVLQQEFAFGTQMASYVGQLIVSLYQQKLTYGEFAQRRYEVTRDTAAAERRFRQAELISDQQRQLQERQVIAQESQARASAWAAYTQTVAARQPLTVRLNCTSMQLSGGMTTTRCQ